MRKFLTACLFLLSSFALAGLVVAQDQPRPSDTTKTEPAAHYYKVTLAVQQVNAEGKPTNSRVYSVILSTRSRQVSMRTGSRVPYQLSDNQWQYQDMGVNFDIEQVQELGRNLAMTINADVSSVAGQSEGAMHHPIVHNNRWNSPVLVPLGKPTLVFTSDDLEDKGSMQVLVTATPVE